MSFEDKHQEEVLDKVDKLSLKAKFFEAKRYLEQEYNQLLDHFELFDNCIELIKLNGWKLGYTEQEVIKEMK